MTPTDNLSEYFTVLKPQNASMDEFYVVQKRDQLVLKP